MDTKAKAEVYLDLEKLDEAAAMFAFLTSSGILSTNHVFYEQVHSFCASALGLVAEELKPNLYPALTQFQNAIQFNCKPVASFLLSGRGRHGSRRHCYQTPQEYVNTHNLSFLHTRSIIRNSPPGHLESSVIKHDVELVIKMCTEKECLSIKNEQCRGYLCSVSTNEMALKPEPEYLAYEDVTKISVSSSEDIIAFFTDSTICYASKGSKNGFFRQQSRLSHWCLLLWKQRRGTLH